MKIESLHIYPVKSCAGIDVASLEFDRHGPLWDRQWVIVDGNFRFLSQRQNPKMALIKTRLSNEALELQVASDRVHLALGGASLQTREVTVWNSKVVGHLESDDVHRILSEFLGVQCFLVRHGDRSSRAVATREMTFDAEFRFADSMPILLTNQKSLKDLNSRLTLPVPMNRFRPNIVVNEGEAFIEDQWPGLRADSHFWLEGSTRCGRCTITTIDQETGESRGPDPLATLAKYRRDGRGIFFGRYFVHRGIGQLVVGQDLQLKEN